MEFVGGRGFKLWNQMLIKIASLYGFGVDQQAAAANLMAHIGGTDDHVLKQAGPQPSTFVMDAHSQTSQ